MNRPRFIIGQPTPGTREGCKGLLGMAHAPVKGSTTPREGGTETPRVTVSKRTHSGAGYRYMAQTVFSSGLRNLATAPLAAVAEQLLSPKALIVIQDGIRP